MNIFLVIFVGKVVQRRNIINDSYSCNHFESCFHCKQDFFFLLILSRKQIVATFKNEAVD